MGTGRAISRHACALVAHGGCFRRRWSMACVFLAKAARRDADAPVRQCKVVVAWSCNLVPVSVPVLPAVGLARGVVICRIVGGEMPKARRKRERRGEGRLGERRHARGPRHAPPRAGAGVAGEVALKRGVWNVMKRETGVCVGKRGSEGARIVDGRGGWGSWRRRCEWHEHEHGRRAVWN